MKAVIRKQKRTRGGNNRFMDVLMISMLGIVSQVYIYLKFLQDIYMKQFVKACFIYSLASCMCVCTCVHAAHARVCTHTYTPWHIGQDNLLKLPLSYLYTGPGVELKRSHTTNTFMYSALTGPQIGSFIKQVKVFIL